jgi:hypothetical protein
MKDGRWLRPERVGMFQFGECTLDAHLGSTFSIELPEEAGTS